MQEFTKQYLAESKTLIDHLDVASIERVVDGLVRLRSQNGRLFILGVGGSAGHASHATNDFRKLCNIETYCPTDNVSELTARINDEGWETSLSTWLKASRLRSSDAILIFSVGGGNREKNVSMNLVHAIEYAKEQDASVFGIVGRDGGFTLQNSDSTIVIPVVSQERVTPHTEGFCAVVWHLIVSHPKLAVNPTKW